MERLEIMEERQEIMIKRQKEAEKWVELISLKIRGES
jgi:hypothetical protein